LGALHPTGGQLRIAVWHATQQHQSNQHFQHRIS
jgi:hypothetical protein